MRLGLDDLQRFAEFLTVRFRAEVTFVAPLPNESGEYLLARLADSLLTVVATETPSEMQVWSTDSGLVSILAVLWLGFRAQDRDKQPTLDPTAQGAARVAAKERSPGNVPEASRDCS